MNSLDNKNGETDIKSGVKTLAEIDEAIARLSAKLAQAPAKAPVASAFCAEIRAKFILTCVVMFISVVTMVFSTFAYFTASHSSSQNIISTGSMKVDYVDLFLPSGGSGGSSGTELDPIKVMPGYVEMREVYADNIGDVSLYVRVKLSTDITLADNYSEYQDRVDESVIIYDINEDYWIKDGNHYYYAAALSGGETTPKLFSMIKFSENMQNFYKGSTIRITLSFETVQAGGNGETVFDAVGWVTDLEGGEP